MGGPRRGGVLLALSALLALSGCASYPKADVSPKGGVENAYRLDELELPPGNTDSTFVVLAFSGGGTRSAAFSFGAMKVLADAKLAGGKFVLLDEVDVISSVSGGSFTSAYYAVHEREKFFEDFTDDVLYRKMQAGLIWRMVAPWNWWKLGSWWYGRSDLAAEYYGRLFDDKKFGDLERKRPMVLLNATDIGMGARFGFEQDHFDQLCSDLNSVAIARGVTASSAFPVAFTPLSFENYPDPDCGRRTPSWIRNGMASLEINGAVFDRARAAKSYGDPDRKVIHLSDGGLSDNIGLRGPMEGLLYASAPLSIHKKINDREIQRVVFIIVDAKPLGKPTIDESGHPPSIFTVLNKAATTPMENYSTDTVEWSRSFIAKWNIEQRSAEGVGPQVAFYAIHVRFDLEKDKKSREELQSIGTKLQLPEDEVDLLVEKGGELMRETIMYRCLMQKIGEPGSADPVSPDDQEMCPEG